MQPNRITRIPSAHVSTEPTEIQTVKLAILGAPNVGKTSIIEQFVCNTFHSEYDPTVQKQFYYSSVIFNDTIFEIKIIDCPVIPYFPLDSFYEWADYRGYGLRSATAYILVYDITSDDSFQYVRIMREQILESRLHDIPIIIVANKFDLSPDKGVSGRREVANLVKKQWKCGYIECSAKQNWHVVLLFKEVLKCVDCMESNHKTTADRVQDALRRNRCTIL
ncbi:unnamed protein product [Owenia fusiformis]|uniref:Ras-like protein family member 10B n=1 Tax=Owenia fusiformis TaxID=6347 RepID=A0A8S4Q4V1_OWEFU|nr:unnamed protein product [Owenia fusiformis]